MILAVKGKTMENIKCDECHKIDAVLMVGFCRNPNVGGSKSSAMYLCNECVQRTMDKYKTMGKPGQVVIVPISPSAVAWHDEANRSAA